MAEIKRTTDRNRAIQAMMTDGEKLKSFYRFVVNNPHIPLHDACQIVIARPNASVCFSFEEWNAQGRRVTKGRKGIPYYDGDGNKYFVFDVTDTHGENRYRRAAQPVKKILDGLDLLNGTEIAGSNRGDYRIMLSGVVTYLGQNDFLTENDEIRNRLIAEGVAYSLYSSTGFPKERGITLKGYPYGLGDNADLFREIQSVTKILQQDINDAVFNKKNEVAVIDDTEEDYVTDEPVLPKADEQPAKQEEKVETPTVSPFYQRYAEIQKDNPDCIVTYRMGDFYEIMGKKAEQAAEILGLTLTGRNVGLPERVPMCGYPYHVADTYLEKLIEKTSVIVVEPDAEPFKILSRAEAGVEHTLVEVTKEESEEFERAFAEKKSGEQSESGIEDDEPTDEEIEEAFAAAEAEETDGDGDSEDYDYEESRKPVKAEKPENKGKRMFERRNRPSMQKSLFDAFETKTPGQELTEQILKGGSGVSGGKIRIYTEYLQNPYEKDFVRFLSKEYGIGGRGGPDGIDEMHDGKGIRFSKKNTETGETEVAVNLKWEQAAAKIADLIDEENYLNDEEKEEYDTLVRFREERSSAKSDDDIIKIIARQIVEYGTSHTYGEKYSAYPHFLGEAMPVYTQHYEEVNAELIKFDEVKSVGKGNIYPYSSPNLSFKLPYCPLWQAKEARLRECDERIKEYADKFTRKCADEYRPTYDKNVVLTVTPEDISSREYLFIKDNREDFIKYFLKQKGVQDVNLSMQKIEITFDRRYIESLIAGKEQTPEERGKIRKIANGIIAEGIKESTEGNYITFFEDFGADKDFVIAHRKEIADELCLREEVSDVEMTDECFDVNYYTDCLWNYKDEKDDSLPVRDLDEEEDEEWESSIASGEIKPIEQQNEPTKESNTDLTEIGFTQSELGGAKQRFRNNVEAIKLVNRLIISQKEATDEEKKVLAKYVGWGGLAQAFDEHNLAWQSEYKELKDVLDDEEYAAAKGSVLNAHYTSKTVIDGIYNALKLFGVKGNNRILEPATGTGNFFGFMPKEIADGAKLYGVELDKITGKIATKLYPQAKIQIKGFEETAFQDNSFDLMVTNVPFGGYTVFDPDYNKYNFYIHDYFLAKGIDKVKPNGLMAVITSKGTMDKQNPSIRKYLADRAELMGAIRLPNTAFKQTANTEVVTDILFFRKREEKINAAIENTEWLATGKTADGYEINNYYISHPEMILGTLVKETGLYGAEDITVKPDGRELSEAINAAIGRLPQGFYVNPERAEETETHEEIEVDYDVKPMNLTAINGKIYMRMGDSMVEQPVPPFPKDAYQRIAEMIEIRKQLRKVLDLQVEGCSDEVLLKEQRQLGTKYDSFVKRFGYINSKNNLRLFKPDGDSALLFACENVSDDEETVTKADVFTKRTIRPYTAVTSTDDCFEALQISKNERGSVDISYIEELTKKDYDTVLTELGNAVFRNPVAVNPEDKYSGFETAEEYLSGRVVDKLQTAERMKQSSPDIIDYDKNIAALKEVQPAPVKASEIAVRVGTSWIDKELYKEFFCQLIALPYYMRDGIELYYNKHDGSWRVDRTTGYVRNFRTMNVTSVYGTERANAYRLFEDCLNQRSTQIYDTVLDADGREKRVLNNSETVAAREKQNKIVEAFKDWIFKDPQRRDELETIYNRLFNQIRLPKYDGSYLRFPEMNPAIELRPHQKDAVHRIITSGNTLLHHIVGSGKTYTICAAAMKLRQYGLAKKPMIAVPNHLVQQWANSFRFLYPTAKLLIATKDDLDKDHREQFVSRVAMGDWDSVIIAQSSFAKINISPERQIAKIREEIEAIERSIEMQWEESGAPSGSVKNLERIKKGREAQLKKLLDETKKDNVLIFEKLGVDYLFVDEADAYKNLFLYTKMNNVAGISNAASARASDLQLKIEYINELHGGDKGVVFATGTPISNSMTEMYTMQTYLQKQTLARLGIDYFDAWAADFGETVTALELAPSGKGYRARTRFAKFTNLPELLTLYHSFADVKTDVKLDVPEAERKVITLKPSDTVIDLTEEIAARADAIYAGGVDPHIDNMLKVTGDGKKLALDPRCIDPSLSDESGSKLSFCADNVYEEWKNSSEIKGTQLVFCDLSTPKKPYSEYVYGKDFDAYNDLKHKIVERGIPENEIAFIHDANTDRAKQDLFDKINAGAVRVLIGSTEKCGAGTNVQKRLVAIHHLDAPYRPRDLIQRNGRGIRQGNMNKGIRIYTYATERTFDSYSYQILENKQRFISQVEKGDMTVREAEDIDEATLSYAEIKAITSANPKIKRKMELDMEMARLRDLESRYKKELFALQDKVRKEFPEQIQRQELYLERVRKDIELIKVHYNPDRFEINVNGTVYSDGVEDGKKNGGLALMDALFHNKTGTVVAEYCGFKISLNPIELIANERSITLSGAGQYKLDIGESASGNLTRLDNFVKDFSEREERAVKRLETTKADFEIAKEQVNVPFEHKDKIIALNTELSELNAELDLNKREEVVIDDGEEDSETNETEEVYAALPKKQTKTRKQKKTMLTEKLYRTYKQTEEKNPGAMVFAVKNGDYTCFDDTTEELMALSSLSPSYFKVGEKEVKTLTIDETLFKEFASAFVSADLKIALFDEPEEEKTFIDESDRVAAMQVDILPDYTVSQEQMHEYGYTWDGMLPVRIRTARVLYGAGVELYRLGKDDTEGKVESGEFEDTESLYGVEKPAWQAFISSERGKAYLTAWHNVVESASEVVNEKMSYLDGMYADSISDGFYEERIAIDRVLNGEYAPSEEAKPFIKPLLQRYHKRFPLDILLEYYGWDYGDVYKALAENIPDAELREYATNTEKEVSFDEFMQKQLSDIDWSDMVDGENDGSFDDIISDLKPEFENSAFNESNDEYPYGYWYDDFAEEKIMPYLREQVKKSGYKSINESVSVESPNYKELVRESVEKEFEEFKANLMGKSAEEIFQNNYEIHVKTELFDTLCGEYVDVGEEYYRALYEEVDHGGILQQLYDDFISSENASVSTGEDTIFFIKDYCEHYHDDILREERIKQDEKQAIFLGKDKNGVAYYHFKDSLSSTNLHAIKEKADRYVIVSPACYIARDTLKKHHIDFLKAGRDIGEDETQKFTVTDVQEAVERKQRERETAKDNIYLHSGSYAQEHGELDKYLLSHSLDEECMQAIGQAISDNYADNRLGKGFEQDLISEYGLERVKHIVTTLIRRSEWDRRYSTENREWANGTVGYEDKSDEKHIYSSAHPGLIDLFADRVRKIEKQKKEEYEEQMSENTLDYTKITARGDKVVNIEKDKNGRDIAIIDRTATSNKDYVVAIGYHTETGDWEQGRYGFETQKAAEEWREKEYAADTKPKTLYTKVKVASDAFIKRSGMGSVFRMPENGEYAGFAYFMFNDKIKPSRQIADLKSDSQELCYELSVRDNAEIDIFKRRGDDEEVVTLTAEEFKKAVSGTTNKDYETRRSDDTKWFTTSIPQEAFRREYDNSMLFVLPNKDDFGGMTYFIPSVFVGEDKNSDDGRIEIRLPQDFVVKAQARGGKKKIELTAYDFCKLANKTTAEDYKRLKTEIITENETEWNYVSVPEKARIASFDESTLFRMPDGEYGDYTYYLPNKCVKDSEENGTIRLSLHNDYKVRLTNNKGEEKKTAELTVKDFCLAVRDKDESAYGESYKKPSLEAEITIEQREKALRTAVPDEMKKRPNWVVVKTWWNAEKGKYNKRPVNCNSDKGEYAESDNPETWTTFDNALKYLKEKGGTTVAYALDGKDKVSCVDIDRCFDENGELSETAKEALKRSGATYAEKSVSGNGLHIFGKTSGMDIRTFSKNGDLEFYQKEHFIAMTGDGAKTKDLINFDTCGMKPYLESKCEKRIEWKGVCKGENGLSSMSDKDVVEKASEAKNGDKFKRLYAGEDLQNNHSNSDMSLMNILAYWCNGDKEQMLRIFATSGLFRPNKSPDYYEGTAIKALRSMPVKSTYTPTIPKNTGGNGKR